MDPRPLLAILSESRELGYLGPGEVQTHITHALGFAAAAESALGRPPASFVDLGTGGGIPGLVLAGAWPSAIGFLVETMHRRCVSLEQWVEQLGLSRATVLEGRAEELAHQPGLREAAEVVVARGFGPPASTAEVATGFCSPGGVVVVSEPPGGDPSRWPEPLLWKLGLGPARPFFSDNAAYVVIEKMLSASNGLPRHRAQPWKRPSW